MMLSRTRLKHIFVFSVALALFGVVPITLIHIMTNVVDTTLIHSDAVRALLMLSPLFAMMSGVVIAAAWVCRHPELL